MPIPFLAISAHSLRRPRVGLCPAGQAAGEVTVVVLLDLIVSARPVRRTAMLNSMSGGLHVEQPNLRPRGCGHHFLHLLDRKNITLGDSHLNRREPEFAQLVDLPLVCWMGNPNVDDERVSIFVTSQNVRNDAAEPSLNLDFSQQPVLIWAQTGSWHRVNGRDGERHALFEYPLREEVGNHLDSILARRGDVMGEVMQSNLAFPSHQLRSASWTDASTPQTAFDLADSHKLIVPEGHTEFRLSRIHASIHMLRRPVEG